MNKQLSALLMGSLVWLVVSYSGKLSYWRISDSSKKRTFRHRGFQCNLLVCASQDPIYLTGEEYRLPGAQKRRS